MSGTFFQQKNNISVTTNQEPNFYNILGKFLSRKEIFKELDSNVWDEDNKIWFVVFKNETVIGFAGITKSNFILLDPIYVLPNYRNQGVGSKLMNYVIEYCKGVNLPYIQSVCTELGEKLHSKHGFVKASSRGKYSIMKYNLK